jgi:undecaprenyl-phosphate 4-deoxy-4-formamido-L-arabinose transferase
MAETRSISIVIPVYNSELTLSPLVAALDKTLPALASQFEVILVNDGSRDKSWSVVQSLINQYSFIRAIDLMRNYGQHNALLAGIRAARYELIVTMDDDLQHPPEEIRSLLDALDDDHDVVYGAPQEEQHGPLRDVASRLTKLALERAMGAEAARSISAFRVFRARVRDAFAHYQGAFVSIDVLLTWGTTRFRAVRVRHDPRPAGQSNYTLGKLIAHAVNLITGFSTLPLQLASWTGFAFTLLGGCVLLYVIGRYIIEGGSVPGFPFLASIIAIFSGAQLFAIGIIGEYLARVHTRTMSKPPYTVRSDSGARELEDGTKADDPRLG